MNDKSSGVESIAGPKRKLELRKESLVELTGWDIRDLSGANGTITTGCGCPASVCSGATAGTRCCPPYN